MQRAYISISRWYAQLQIAVLDVGLIKIEARILQHMLAHRTECSIATDDQIGGCLQCCFRLLTARMNEEFVWSKKSK